MNTNDLDPNMTPRRHTDVRVSSVGHGPHIPHAKLSLCSSNSGTVARLPQLVDAALYSSSAWSSLLRICTTHSGDIYLQSVSRDNVAPDLRALFVCTTYINTYSRLSSLARAPAPSCPDCPRMRLTTPLDSSKTSIVLYGSPVESCGVLGEVLDGRSLFHSQARRLHRFRRTGERM